MGLSSLVPTASKHRVAILVDGDNFPRNGIDGVETEAKRLGDVTIRRVYGDMALHKDWAQDIAYTATHSPTSAGKNRADMMLVVAAMDLAHRGLATAYVIVSDDRDFAPLVNHLREQGYPVEWHGKPKAVGTKTSAPIPKTSARPTLDEKLKEVILDQPDAKEGVPLVRLGHLMKGETVKAQTGKATWRSYLRERPELFVIEGEGPSGRVRLKT